MQYAKFVFAALTFFLVIPFAFSQDAVMVMNHKELDPHERPVVQFTHEQHAGKIDCAQCHHDYDEYLNNKGGEGGNCAGCHGEVHKDGKPSLMEAFHGQCKGCHAVMKRAGKPNTPITCGECHIRK
jgi:hypothetical protein